MDKKKPTPPELTGRGGPDRGQGRKPTGRKRVQLYATPEEEAKLRALLEELRK